MVRSIEALVEEQVRRWQLLRQEPREEIESRPVMTVTGQHGALGDHLSRRLASELGFDHFDREILHRVAESAQLSESVVASMDGKKRALFTDWLAAVASRNYFGPTEYRYHLAHVIGAIAHQGGAVIVGRGAHLLLGDAALRVLAVAPLEDRVRTVMEAEGLTERDARRRIVEVEAERHAFILMQYHAEFADPTVFDLVVNTSSLGLDGASAAVRAALATRPSRTAPLDADVRAPGAGS